MYIQQDMPTEAVFEKRIGTFKTRKASWTELKLGGRNFY